MFWLWEYPFTWEYGSTVHSFATDFNFLPSVIDRVKVHSENRLELLVWYSRGYRLNYLLLPLIILSNIASFEKASDDCKVCYRTNSLAFVTYLLLFSLKLLFILAATSQNISVPHNKKHYSGWRAMWGMTQFQNWRNLRIGDLKLTSMSPLLLFVRLCVCICVSWENIIHLWQVSKKERAFWKGGLEKNRKQRPGKKSVDTLEWKVLGRAVKGWGKVWERFKCHWIGNF